MLFRRNRESSSREVCFVHHREGTAGAGIWPEQCPEKCAAEKGTGLTELGENGNQERPEEIA